MNVPGTQNEPTREPVVDAHTHIFPDEIIGDRANFLARDLWFEHLYASPRALLVGPGELIASMDTAGIEQSVICGFPWRDPGLCRIHNDFMADVSAKSNGRLPWLGIVAPGSGTEAVNEAQRCFDLGASGLGELNADAQSFDLTDTEGLTELFEFCFESNRPIMLHASEPVGHHYPGKGASTPDRLLKMIQALPEVRFVLAHWGGGLPFFELMPEVEAITSNIWYDTAASTYLYRWGVFRSVLDIVGPDRVLFASDYPILKQDRFIQKVQGIPWKDNDERKAVLCENARNVYGLKP
jgi:predicted TIM-barrel fold metal-dependent hydrolase